MKLSELIRTRVKFQVKDAEFPLTGKLYKRFGECVIDGLRSRGVDSEMIPDMFPLAFAFPLFYGENPKNDYMVVNNLLPEGAKLPNKTGIYFLCDAIDCMAVRLRMNETQVADIVEEIEDHLGDRCPVGMELSFA